MRRGKRKDMRRSCKGCIFYRSLFTNNESLKACFYLHDSGRPRECDAEHCDKKVIVSESRQRAYAKEISRGILRFGDKFPRPKEWERLVKKYMEKSRKWESVMSCKYLEERGYCTSQKTCEHMEDFGEGYVCTIAEAQC